MHNTEAQVDTVVIKDGQNVFFVNLKDGQTVKSPVKVEMGVNGMTVEPIGAVNPDKGHHHLIIDASFIPAGTTTPADSTHIHFGKGQTETEVKLSPGKHTLTLQFADGMHTSYGVRMSKTITVEVK
ncbi:rod shape-determining protein RodA [Solitalea longa]|uniref:Rod shape-determining protein RodA n=2 Tax=Solitalea longa TaxID=2079460 RepID=A0A2S5A2G0_9SPHI|nr:rod shape-determining protein RodA [Solitalea longa]